MKKVDFLILILVASLTLSALNMVGRLGGTVQALEPTVMWSHNYGDYYFDEKAYSVVQTSDGGYLLAGTNYSYPYTPTGTHALLLKTDSSGNMQWNMSYAGGGYGDDEIRCVVKTSDGGYAFAGYTQTAYVVLCSWLAKTNSGGNMIWSKTYAAGGTNYAYSMVQTSDGGYALAGKGPQGSVFNAMLVKTDSDGNMIWTKYYVHPDYPSASSVAYSIVQTSDGGYALAGSAVWKTDWLGNLQWSKPLGDSEAVYAYSIVKTSDGGYAYAGAKNSLTALGYNIYLIKTDSSGNFQWGMTGYNGGDDSDICYSLVQTSDGGYALAGSTQSFGHGGWDVYLVKTDSSGVFEWQEMYGGALDDESYCVIQTSDGGLALAGRSRSYTNGGDDMWLIKLSPFLPLTYSATIWAWDALDPNGWIAEPITMDGGSTGFSTPHTFTGLSGTHTFTVPSTDVDGRAFSNWYTGETSTTITVTQGGIYTARYGWPSLNVRTWYWTGDTVIKSVATGDVDGDGKIETVTGGYYWDGSRYKAQLCVWDGTTLALKNVQTWYWTSTTLILSVAVGDVNKDGKNEIVTGGYYNDGTRNVAQLCVWDGATLALKNVKTWYWTGDTEIVSVAVGDVDGDSNNEIVTGGNYYDSLYKAQLCVWDGATLALKNDKEWYWTSWTFINSVGVGDVDADGKAEIVTGGVYYNGFYRAQLCVWDGATLALKNDKEWYWTGKTYIYSVAVGDVDADGKNEIVTGGLYNDGTRNVAQLCVWNGATLALKNVKTWYWTGNTEIDSVGVGDVDADGKNEIVTGGLYNDGTRNVAQLCVWNGATLALKNVKTWYWTGDTGISSVAVGAIYGDGKSEIVTGGSYNDGTRQVAQLCVWA